MEGSLTLQTLPYEVRCMIWDAVGEQQDFCSLLQTSRQIRSDILCGIPGGVISCGCDSDGPCEHVLELHELAIIVEPHCSEGSWLKFAAIHVPNGRRSVWTVRGLDSVLNRNLFYYQPKKFVIEFHAPKKGYYLGAFVTLMAKLDDLSRVMGWVQPQENVSLHVCFTDPWQGAPTHPAKSFWERRPMRRTNMREKRRDGPAYKFYTGMRLTQAYFYELLLVPLLWSPDWRNAQVTFERAIGRKSTSFRSQRFVPQGEPKPSLEYYGYKKLALVIWGVVEHFLEDDNSILMQRTLGYQGKIEGHESNAAFWSSHEGDQRMAWLRAMLSLSCRVRHFPDVLKPFLRDFRGEAADQLRSCVLRAHSVSTRSRFLRVGRVHREGETTRNIYVEWALCPQVRDMKTLLMSIPPKNKSIPGASPAIWPIP